MLDKWTSELAQVEQLLTSRPRSPSLNSKREKLNDLIDNALLDDAELTYTQKHEADRQKHEADTATMLAQMILLQKSQGDIKANVDAARKNASALLKHANDTSDILGLIQFRSGMTPKPIPVAALAPQDALPAPQDAPPAASKTTKMYQFVKAVLFR